MPSVLNVDTLTDAAGTGPVTLTKQSAAKAWGHFEGSDATLDDSFNCSSLTDNGTGDFNPQFSSNMVNAHFAAAADADYNINQTSNARAAGQATGTVRIATADTGSLSDENDTSFSCHGDLA